MGLAIHDLAKIFILIKNVYWLLLIKIKNSLTSLCTKHKLLAIYLINYIKHCYNRVVINKKLRCML